MNPIEGDTVKLAEKCNLNDTSSYGPSGVSFERGYVKLQVEFPDYYLIMPPRRRFLTIIWRPNVFLDGEVNWFQPESWSVHWKSRDVLIELVSPLRESSALCMYSMVGTIGGQRTMIKMTSA